MKKIYLVDSENVGDVWVPLLVTSQPEDQVLVFYTQKSPHMNYENVRMLKETEKEAVFIKCFEGSNALDFQLVTELGFRLKDDEGDCEYIIVSNDTGFDAAVRYWSARKMPVRRLNGKDCSKKTANLGRQTETKPQTEPISKPDSKAGEGSVPGQKQLAEESARVEQDSEAGTVQEGKTDHTKAPVKGKNEGGAKASKTGKKKEESRHSSERVNKDEPKVPDAALNKDDAKHSDAALNKNNAKHLDGGMEPDEPKTPDAEVKIGENNIFQTKAVTDGTDIINPGPDKDETKITQAKASKIKSKPDETYVSKEKETPEKKKLSDKKTDAKQKNNSDELHGSSKPGNSAESSGFEKDRGFNENSLSEKVPKQVKSLTGETGSEENIIKNLLFCISKENLADFHNALVMFFGEEKGKEIYQDIKNDPEILLDWSQIPECPQAEKFEMYCKLVFEHGELAEEYPADFAGFLLKCNGKRKNLNSLRAALQGQYGKDKGMRYYSLFKSHIKIMNRM